MSRKLGRKAERLKGGKEALPGRLLAGLLVSSALVALPALAQTPPASAPAEATQETGAGNEAGDVNELAKIIKFETRPRTVTPVTENEPVPLDMEFGDVPDIPPALTEGVTAKAYARYVVVDDKLIGQLVLGGVAKEDKLEPLDTEKFVSQFDLEKPELPSTAEVVVEGDHEELLAALKRLAEEEPKEEKEKKPEEDDGRDGRDGTAGRVGGSAPANDAAAAYQNPEPMELPEEKDEPLSVTVTTEGCDVRVDLAQGVAIQQNRVATTEDGQTTYGECEDGPDRFPIERSYAACPDAVDLEAREARPQYVLFYTDAGGGRNEVGECQPDADQVFPIVEDLNACPIYLDYAAMEAVPRATLSYVNANNATVEVRGCEASEEKDAVPLEPVTDGCSIRHAFSEGKSYQLGRHQYVMDGVTWLAGACTENDTKYPHETVYEDAGGQLICAPIIDEDGGQVTLQNRVQIVVDGIEQFITPCRPDTTSAAIMTTTEGCENPATWLHDKAAGVSYALERDYYVRDGERVYLNDCHPGSTTYPHQVENAGWENHDDQLYALERSRIYITPPSGRYVIAASEILDGAPQMPYVYERQDTVPTGEVYYEGCSAWTKTALSEVYTRPDGTTFTKPLGEGAPQGPREACTIQRPAAPSDWTHVSTTRRGETFCTRTEQTFDGESWFEHCADSTAVRTDTYRGVHKAIREDGVVVSEQAADRVESRIYSGLWQTPQYTSGASSIQTYHSLSCADAGGSVGWYAYSNARHQNMTKLDDLCASFTPSATTVSTWLSELGW
jgi:hypothetical protein